MGKLEVMAINYLASGSWDLTNFLKNSERQLNVWGGLFLTLIGVAGVIWAATQIVTGLMSHGKKQVSYGVNVLLLIIAGALATTGLTLVMNIAEGGKKTIEDLGVIIPQFKSMGLDLSTIGLLVRNGLLF